MAKFGSLEQFFDPTLTLTVHQREYIPPLPSGELGLWCRTLSQSRALHDVATDEQRKEALERLADLPDIPGWKPGLTFQELLLGDTYARMMADGVEHHYIDFCVWTVLIWIISGEPEAQRYWESGGRPEARSPANRAQRRASERTHGTPTGGAPTTPPPASTSGTSRPRRRRSRG